VLNADSWRQQAKVHLSHRDFAMEQSLKLGLNFVVILISVDQKRKEQQRQQQRQGYACGIPPEGQIYA